MKRAVALAALWLAGCALVVVRGQPVNVGQRCDLSEAGAR